MLENTLNGDSALFASSRAQRRRQQRVQPVQPLSSDGPQDPNKRKTLLALAAGGATLLAGGAVTKFFVDAQRYTPDQDYNNWERYDNKVLPPELVIRLGQDLQSLNVYPGFHQAGELLVTSQQQPDRLRDFAPEFNGMLFPVMVVSKQTQTMLTVIRRARIIGTLIEDKQAHTTIQVNLNDIKDVSLGIEIDGKGMKASPNAKRLLLVKEISHLFYYPQAKQRVVDAINARYNIETTSPRASDFSTFIFYSGFDRLISPQRVPSLGDEFDNAYYDIDGAGQWHIIPALGKMRTYGLLSDYDLSVLSTPNRAFDASVEQGLLIEKEKGEFVWKEGVGPFSSEWIKLMRPIFPGYKK